ncbi:ecto-ADP-ribosyltransferase 5-like isoform X2 [Thunnus albacares]|uniref:ecto-ADP-ribosyltransferase 5-like isoform X2 n=1 Tax=Thunnus albacares TaxID=8236 RepID=UPI001CF62C02|nr:ecto-ADP-ribosyltransferase 5-like isoform X2 [Thunnus albacares]
MRSFFQSQSSSVVSCEGGSESCIKNSSSFPLNMAPDAVDDMYCGCTKEMEKKVNSTYFKEENVGTFKDAWENAETCSNNKQKDPEDEALTKNHMRAICAYTSDYKKNPNDKKLYEEFNTAVRTSKNTYNGTFQFHSLHYWLTTAIQILNRNQGCQTTYRRTNVEFTGKVKQIIRFGMFASSSKRTVLYQFGNKTCFKIKTCSGAYLKNYSKIPDEKEVLIPPYETFKITKISKDKKKFPDIEKCKKFFILESEGVQSNLNCKAAR